MVARPVVWLLWFGVLGTMTACDEVFDLTAVELTDATLMVDDAGGDAPLPDCMASLELEDGFTSGLIDTSVWIPELQLPEETVQVVNDQLELAVGSGAVPIGRYAGLRTATLRDLTSRRFSARIIEVPSAGGSLQAALFARTSDNLASSYVLVEGDALTCGTKSNQTFATHCTEVYDSAIHRFWAVRVADSAVIWEVSQDRTSWTVLATRPVHYDPAQLELGMYVYQLRAGVDPGKMVADDVQLCGPPTT